jgi:4-hydroxy-tetrahydrodipicolinate synthase
MSRASLSSVAGVCVIAPTPLHPDGRIDEASLDRMTDFYGEAGCSGITVLGQLGEAPKLDVDEALAVATRVIRRARLPVIVGVSAPRSISCSPGSPAMMRVPRS